MADKSSPWRRRLRFEPYWYLIGLFWLTAAILFLRHLASGRPPSRVLFQLPVLELDIYWYGLIIVGGIGLGAYVVSQLVAERGQRAFEATVPPKLRARPLAKLPLDNEISLVLARQKIITVGDAIFNWGHNPAQLNLNKAGLAALRQQLLALPQVKAAWLDDAPWRPWNPDHVWNGLMLCLVLGVIGARLYHVLTPSPSMAAVGIHSPLDYFRQPFMLINLRMGGLGIYGGIIGGLVGLIWYTRRHRLPTLAWADLATVGLALGQAVGRWGNFFNQELYGRPTDLPWAIPIELRYRLPEYSDFSHFHPAFLYESLWNFMVFVLLWTLARRYRQRLFPGDLLALYLILYAIGRTLLETVRLDSRAVSLAGIDLLVPVATLVSLVIAVLMAAWLAWRHKIAPGSN